MTAGAGVIDRAIEAARAGDLDGLRELIDWPLTGGPGMVSGLADVDERDRASAAESGLTELAEAAGSTALVEEILRPVAATLAGARGVRPAGAETAGVLAIVRVPEVPTAGLREPQVARLAELRARAAALTEVFVVATVTGDFPVVRAADSGLLVLPMD